MSITLVQPFNLDPSKSYTLGNLTVNGNATVGNLSGVTNITASGNLTFTGSAARIIGDFSNATHLNRTMFQTSVANSATVVGAIPNGTSAISVFRAFNAADPTNSPFTEISANPGDSRLTAGALGSGTALPMTFYTGGTERLRLDTTGNLALNSNTANARLDVNGSIAVNIVSVPALDIDCSQGTFFTKTVNGASTFTFSNVPQTRAYSFVLELTFTSGTVGWPASVQWPGGTAPTLTTGKIHLLIFVTDNGGTTWLGASSINYNT